MKTNGSRDLLTQIIIPIVIGSIQRYIKNLGKKTSQIMQKIPSNLPFL